MPDQVQLETRLQLSRSGSQFEVMIIQAGQTGPTRGYPKGLAISSAVLQASVPMWNDVQSFVDHKIETHSLRDLCGVLSDPQWDETRQGVKAIFTPFGPAADVALSVANDVMEHPELTDHVGFSADFYFENDKGTVKQIYSANSADLVIKPAAGGKWLRALNQIHKELEPMTEPIPPVTPPDAAAAVSEAEANLLRLQAGAQAVIQSQQAQAALSKLDEANAAAQRLQVQMCQSLLSATLAGSHLPAAWQDRIAADFKGRAFEASELQARIDADRLLLSATTAGHAVQGPSIRGMFNAEDQLKAAVDDMFGNPRDENLRQAQAARLTGIRELYMMLTGDYDLHGSVVLDRAQFQLGTTNFTILVKNALNKSLQRHWDQFGKAGYDWWTQIATVEHFTSLNDITWAIFGTIGSLPTVAEGAEYTPLMIADNGETSSFVKKGGYVGLTLEAIDRDDIGGLKGLPKELAFAGIRELSALVAALFTDNTATGPLLADGGYLFNSTAVTTAGGHANLLTTALGTDYTAWDAVAQAMFKQPMLVANVAGYIGLGKKMAVEPKFCLVPRKLRGAANTLFATRQIAYGADNAYYGQVFPITVPEWTDDTDWAAVADPNIVPGVMIGERFGLMPEIFVAGNENDPAVFMNDESRIKVRHFMAVGVADFRPLHKENVAG